MGRWRASTRRTKDEMPALESLAASAPQQGISSQNMEHHFTI
jgi:hypothetical protein